MTEQEWLAAHPQAMLDFLGRKATPRQLRLFGAACARSAFAWLASQPRAVALVETVELLADGLASRADLQKARRALPGSLPYVPVGLVWAARAKPADAARFFAQVVGVAAQQQHADLLRHIFGNPFRPYHVPASWPPLVVDLAEQQYAGEDVRLILHDALLDVGHAELAEHFRVEEGHPKGCWVLDLVLGKE